MLNLMACKAQDRGVDFEVNVGSDISGLIGAGIERREFNTLLADLAENAIISAGAAKERHVEVMLLRNDENYCLEVLDSGDRFDLGVLKNMGKKRITTHSGEGGSGIGPPPSPATLTTSPRPWPASSPHSTPATPQSAEP